MARGSGWGAWALLFCAAGTCAADQVWLENGICIRCEIRSADIARVRVRLSTGADQEIEWREVVAIDDEPSSAFRHAQELAAAGRDEEARRAYEKIGASSECPWERGRVRVRLMAWFVAHGREPDAARLYVDAARRDPRNAFMGQTPRLSHSAELMSALDALRRSAGDAFLREIVDILRADAHAAGEPSDDRLARADKILEALLASRTPLVRDMARLRRGRVALLRNAPDRAEALVLEGRENRPGALVPTEFALLGRVRLKQGMREAGLAEILRAGLMWGCFENDAAEALLLASRELARSGRPDEAEKTLQIVLTRHAGTAYARCARGRLPALSRGRHTHGE